MSKRTQSTNGPARTRNTKYSFELRQRIVDLARRGRSAASLAREFGPSATLIRRWR